MAILCLGNRSLHLDGYGFIGELALDGSVRPVTGVLPMARCLRAAGVVRHLAVAEENAAEAALVDSLAVIGVSSLQRCVAPHVGGSGLESGTCRGSQSQIILRTPADATDPTWPAVKAAYWRHHRSVSLQVQGELARTGAPRSADAQDPDFWAWEYVHTLCRSGDRAALDRLVDLADSASNDEELGHLGAGPAEDLVRVFGEVLFDAIATYMPCSARRKRGERWAAAPLGSQRTTTHSSTSAAAREPAVHRHERPAAVTAVGSGPGGGRVDRAPHQGSDCNDEQDQTDQPDHGRCPKAQRTAQPTGGSPRGDVRCSAGGWAFRGAFIATHSVCV